MNTHIIVIFLDFKIELEGDFMIKFIEKERYYDDSSYTGSCYYYPTYMIKDGEEFFVFNRREPDDEWKIKEDKARKNEPTPKS